MSIWVANVLCLFAVAFPAIRCICHPSLAQVWQDAAAIGAGGEAVFTSDGLTSNVYNK